MERTIIKNILSSFRTQRNMWVLGKRRMLLRSTNENNQCGLQLLIESYENFPNSNRRTKVQNTKTIQIIVGVVGVKIPPQRYPKTTCNKQTSIKPSTSYSTPPKHPNSIKYPKLKHTNLTG